MKASTFAKIIGRLNGYKVEFERKEGSNELKNITFSCGPEHMVIDCEDGEE